MEKKRCKWAGNDPLYMEYHDKEWGKPVYDDATLYEFILLEGFQAGLSWITILRKRENFRKAFDNFDYRKIALYNDEKLEALRQDEGIVRNRLKIKAAKANALAFIKVQAEFGSFSDYIWAFMNHKQVVNHWASIADIPSKTELSDKISKDLKKRGFTFVGSTIVYAFMQSMGIVDDHEDGCWCREQI